MSRARALLALALSFPLLATGAQAAGLTLKRVDGALGGPLRYDLAGDPLETYVLMISLNAGPIPLSLVNPLDTRVLEVGFELQPAWVIAGLNGAGDLEDAVGQRRLAMVDVGDDREVPDAVELHGNRSRYR